MQAKEKSNIKEDSAKKAQLLSKASLAFSMTVFGTIGIFVRSIELPSSFVAMTRGFLGVLFLLAFKLVRRQKVSLSDVKSNIWLLFASGAAIGVNWILLFESYNYTSVATATLCYYLAPIFVTVASPFVLKEKLSAKKLCCVLCALFGMIFVSGVFENGGVKAGELKGILLGTGAAAFYAAVMLLNKKLHGIADTDRTIMQLLFASLTVTPYVLLTENVASFEYGTKTVLLLLTVGIIHTGFSYTLFFGSVGRLPAQTTALFSYIDPVVAILLSALLLKEKLVLFDIIGAVMILGSTLVSEFSFKRERK